MGQWNPQDQSSSLEGMEEKLLKPNRVIARGGNMNPICVLFSKEDKLMEHLFNTCPYSKWIICEMLEAVKNHIDDN